MNFLMYCFIILLIIIHRSKISTASSPVLRRHLQENNDPVWDYCQNMERFINLEYDHKYSRGGSGHGCSCGVLDHNLDQNRDVYGLSCSQNSPIRYVFQNTRIPGPRVTTSLSSVIRSKAGTESYSKCISIQDYHTVDAHVPMTAKL